MAVTLGLVFVAFIRKERPMTFIAVRCSHCQSDQIVKCGTLLLDSRVLRDQELNERRQQRFAALADVVHELEEPQVDREFLLGNPPMRTQPTA